MEKQVQTHPGVSVRTFGRFALSYEGKVLDDDNIRSEMVTKLLAYALCHRDRVIPVSEFVDVLWEADESDNPAGALKNLMYRLRTLMKKILGQTDFILTGRGAYYWNPAYPVALDAERFTALCAAAQKSDQPPEERKQTALAAAELYSGAFLPKLSAEHWVIPLATYYHSMYLTLVKQAAVFLEQAREYENMARVCAKAIDVDPLDEKLHYHLIKALIGQGKQNLAIEHYHKAPAMLYENLGISPSDELREIYQEIVKLKHAQEMDLGMIQRDLLEAVKPKGVFLCEYGVFREIYRLEYRRMQRLGMSVYVSLATLSLPAYVSPESEGYLKMIGAAMQQMKQALSDTLRVGDVASQYSGTQYIVMLPTCNYETANQVMGRVLERFYKINKKQIAKIQLSYAQLPSVQL